MLMTPPPRIINCTPHPVHYYVDGCRLYTFPESSAPARVKIHRRPLTAITADSVTVQVNTNWFDEVGENIPAQEDGTWYIVSGVVASAFPDRQDFLVPDESIIENRKVIGCQSFHLPMRTGKPDSR